MWRASTDQRNNTARAISIGWPPSPSGIVRTSRAQVVGGAIGEAVAPAVHIDVAGRDHVDVDVVRV